MTPITDEELFAFILDSTRQARTHLMVGAAEAVKYRLDIIESALTRRPLEEK